MNGVLELCFWVFCIHWALYSEFRMEIAGAFYIFEQLSSSEVKEVIISKENEVMSSKKRKTDVKMSQSFDSANCFLFICDNKEVGPCWQLSEQLPRRQLC